MDNLKRALSGNDQCDEKSGIIDRVRDRTTISWARIQGFAICFIIGILCSILGSFALFLHRGLTVFAAFYTLGNIVSLASTGFLVGPVRQFKSMFASTRVIATCLVFASIGLTLFSALYLKNPGLALLFIIIQSLAMTWYSLSYIPYARDVVRGTVQSCIS